jgi:protein-arginine kinase activator protein McsA
MNYLDCRFCGETFAGHRYKEAKKALVDHQVITHRDELEEEFRNSWKGKGCQSCGKTYSEPDSNEDGLLCPYCYHDHSRYWAGVSDASAFDI